MSTKPDYLFIGVYPNAFVYTDLTRETDGDYHEIAAVYFRPLDLKIFDYSIRYSEAIDMAIAEYMKIKSDPTQPIVISATGQTVNAYLREESQND